MKELLIPPAVETDTSAREIARVWASRGEQHVSLAVGIWSDPAAWGLMLVDLARHVAAAYEQTQGKKASEVLARIKEALEVEWENPTDSPSDEGSPPTGG